MNGNNISPASNNGAANNKKKRKFNIIDFFILVLIVALIASLVYALSPWSQLKKLWSTDEISFQYSVEFKNVDEQFIQLIENGDLVINSITKKEMGTVIDVDRSQKSYKLHYKENTDSEGKITIEGTPVELENQYDITVYIKSSAIYEQGKGYTVNGDRIAIGEELSLRFPQFERSGYCVSIATDS